MLRGLQAAVIRVPAVHAPLAAASFWDTTIIQVCFFTGIFMIHIPSTIITPDTMVTARAILLRE